MKAIDLANDEAATTCLLCASRLLAGGLRHVHPLDAFVNITAPDSMQDTSHRAELRAIQKTKIGTTTHEMRTATPCPPFAWSTNSTNDTNSIYSVLPRARHLDFTNVQSSQSRQSH